MEQAPNLYLSTADFYDSDNEELDTSDIDFYLNYAEEMDGPVLDLCCGTGRVALPLATSGYNVTAVDLSLSMLDVLSKKTDNLDSEKEANIKIVHGDMKTISLNTSYKLIIIALRSFQVLQSKMEVEGTLKNIRRHLDPDGSLIINLFKPLEDMTILEGLEEEKIVKEKNGQVLYKRSGKNTKIDTEEQMLYCNFEYRPRNTNNDEVVLTERLQIKYYYEHEFRVILEQNGFFVKACYGNYDRCETYHENATELIYVCKSENTG
ncbi:MAG: Methyltransferase type 12 [Chitinophagaceae bacterium]|nr:Methyltransferase type 12 [Chitinophagaceae bacterium]